MRTARQAVPSGCLVAHCGQQPFKLLAAGAACAQVGPDTWVSLLRWSARGHQVDVDMEKFHRLGASRILRIGPQETVEF